MQLDPVGRENIFAREKVELRETERERERERDLCPATYLAALFTGQKAVCIARVHACTFLFVIYLQILCVRASERSLDAVFFRSSFCSTEYSRNRILLRGLQSGPPPSAPFFCPHFITSLSFFSRETSLTARSSSRFYVVWLGRVSISAFSSPEFRSKKVLRSSIRDRSHPPFARVTKRRTIAIRPLVNNVQPDTIIFRNVRAVSSITPSELGLNDAPRISLRLR